MIQVINIPAFSDNYIWLITHEERKFGVIVDPGDAQPVLAELEQRGIEPLALLITHHHRGGLPPAQCLRSCARNYSPDNSSPTRGGCGGFT